VKLRVPSWIAVVVVLGALWGLSEAVSRWPWASISLTWTLRFGLSLLAFSFAKFVFAQSRTLKLTAVKGAAVLVAIALYAANTFGDSSCDEEGDCIDYEGPPITFEKRLEIFWMWTLVLGVPITVAYKQARDSADAKGAAVEEKNRDMVEEESS
jgi:hypothetical protein